MGREEGDVSKTILLRFANDVREYVFTDCPPKIGQEMERGDVVWTVTKVREATNGDLTVELVATNGDLKHEGRPSARPSLPSSQRVPLPDNTR